MVAHRLLSIYMGIDHLYIYIHHYVSPKYENKIKLKPIILYVSPFSGGADKMVSGSRDNALHGGV